MNKAKHIVIAVRDIDKSLAFYRDVLGLKYLRTLKRKDGGTTIDLTDGDVHFALVSRSGQTSPTQGGEQSFGLDHIGFFTDDINDTYNRLKEAGAKFITDTPTDLFKIEDPDGVKIDISPRLYDRF